MDYGSRPVNAVGWALVVGAILVSPFYVILVAGGRLADRLGQRRAR